MLPVNIARNGFTPLQSKHLRNRYTYEQVISAGDVSLFHFLNLGLWLPTVIVPRRGTFVDLSTDIDIGIGQTCIANATDGIDLNDYLHSEVSRTQGMIVMHQGRVVLEEYPGMRPSDGHVWMSVAKTTVSLVVRLLVEEGKINVQNAIDFYITELCDTDWADRKSVV